ncbi:MAG: S-ribosylhomocysteine lyase, partial [Clostridia bacterium]|nr:S-ribosylhomocysteine lyase [Clostridia bacterium]
MERIKSFTVDHMTLLPGVYVSREDRISYMDAFSVTAGDVEKENISEKEAYPVTTYDIRMTRPNFEPVMGTGEIHAIEHLGATYLRNREDIKSRVIYWGPMGCRTG